MLFTVLIQIWDSENSDMQFNGCTWTESNSNFEGGGIFILVSDYLLPCVKFCATDLLHWRYFN